MRHGKITLLFLLVTMLCVATARAQDAGALLGRIHSFDISCEMFNEKFEKKTCGQEHIAAYTQLIRLEDTAGTLATVEAAKKDAKKKVKELEKIKEEAPVTDYSEEYAKLVADAQAGDETAVAKLYETDDVALIPYLIAVAEGEGVLPSDAIISRLVQLEQAMDEALIAGGAGLNADVVGAAVQREENYVESLGRAVIALEGTRRKFPAWLPFVYAYGVGLIPFAFGIIASIKYYGKLESGAAAVIVVCYLFYVCLHGFFQFIAPRI